MEEKIKEYVDGIYEPVKEWVITRKIISTTMLQRRFRIGYTRAARIINRLEENNIIEPREGRGPRIVLANK
ncbi:TPA: cell division protein FtsK [Bacillus thuringiensis]|uniref:Cell division protein FtsK n=1 Tax=Bacillus wiedmannii TaxID=1890302 RepID=A0A2B5NKW1_9BACI|nr:DNA translocase FtsK [Bacillus wiedmannii]HDR8183738.1 cell division protein FtsK [Bacillus thuringiensis]MDM5264806.1 DNA translocase FtsK [Bacillus wiedmannii]MEE3949961.1 DNA translocase FtsK [Bacillus wiedmannii]PDY35315.1 cell division protein FtsK [Bacillus wiedmannii]PFZ86177.1 cell division protein FtsK [Bacillus wiedmannii]